MDLAGSSGELTEAELEFLNSVFDIVRQNKPLALQSLLDQGVPANLTNAQGDSLLILAAYHEHVQLLELLLAAGADVNAINDRGQTALVCAVFKNNPDIVKLLLAAGADKQLGNQSALQVADFFGLEQMKELLQATA